MGQALKPATPRVFHGWQAAPLTTPLRGQLISLAGPSFLGANMRKYIIFAVLALIIVVLHQFRLIIEEHRLEKTSLKSVKSMEEYVIRARHCRLMWPRANARKLHECATK
jgi:hypothetical protein